MAPRAVRFNTSLSASECDTIFKTTASTPLFKNRLLRLGEKMNDMTGAQQTGLFTPDTAPGYTAPGDEPLFSLGWSFENKYVATFVQMDVWEHDDHRTVELYVPNSSNKYLNKFIEAFRNSGRTDL